MTASKHILVYGGGWIQNMGNAFIQIGSRYAVEQAAPGAHVHLVDGNDIPVPLSPPEKILTIAGNFRLLHSLKNIERKRNMRIQKLRWGLWESARIDVVVFSGVWLSKKFLESHRSTFSLFRKRNIPIVFNGCGGTLYTPQEIADVTAILKEICPFGIISRDDATHHAYKNIFDRVSPGIDVGFFSMLAHGIPLPTSEQYTVYCFDRGPLPKELPLGDTTILTHHSVPGIAHNAFDGTRVFYSEFAQDYLNLYANAQAVYSDRVHACVAALASGRPAQLMDSTPRAQLFATVGAENVTNALTQLDMNLLRTKQEHHVSALRKILADLP